MNRRHLFALAHPINRANGEIRPYRTVERRRDGLLVVVLAVDR